MSICDNCIHDYVCGLEDNHEDGLIFCADMIPKTRWISVREKLPEIHQDVLLSLRSLDVKVGFRAKTEPYFYCHSADGCYIEPQNVLAWMPLPEPYEQEE